MENKYGLYLSREGTTVRLPVNPESYTINRDNDNGNYNVLGVGPIMIPRTPKLQTGLLVRPPAGPGGSGGGSHRRGLPAAQLLYRFPPVRHGR